MSELLEVDVVATEGIRGGQVQTLWSHLLIEELVRHGVGLFVLAPGSRSTPLALAVAENPNAQHLMHFDERGGAFVALGFARATGKPAVLITTSGTAVANGLPAVVEADADGVPLILLTADRPPELRESGANQTIRQHGIFAPYVRWQFDMPVPDAAIDPAFVLTTVGQVAHQSQHLLGPVHLNCMFREPLAPNEIGRIDVPESLGDWQNGNQPYTRYPVSKPAVSTEEIEALATRLEGLERGLVVLGNTDDTKASGAAAGIAHSLGWPLLADVASGGRLGGTSVVCYDLIFSSSKFFEAHQPHAVIHLGGAITSKPLHKYIENCGPSEYIVVRPDANRYDPSHIVTDRFQSDITAFCDAFAEELVAPSRESAWTLFWRTASADVSNAVQETLPADELSEPAVARAISAFTPEGHGLVLASSMPIRDMDAFAVTDGPRLRVAANRGASGIDGTVATAAGFARGLTKPTTLFIGDLALLHDLNSLSLLREGPPVTVVVINNDGGGIFSFLPIAEQKGVFEQFFGTPHGLGFEKAAEMFELGYDQPTNMAEFKTAYSNAVKGGVSSIIEVRTNREENVALHRELKDAVSAAVGNRLDL